MEALAVGDRCGRWLRIAVRIGMCRNDDRGKSEQTHQSARVVVNLEPLTVRPHQGDVWPQPFHFTFQIVHRAHGQHLMPANANQIREVATFHVLVATERRCQTARRVANIPSRVVEVVLRVERAMNVW